MVKKRGNLKVPKCEIFDNSDFDDFYTIVRHVTGNDEDYLRKIPRVVVQKSALLKGPL